MGNFRLVKNIKPKGEYYIIEVPLQLIGGGGSNRLLYVTPEAGLSSDMDDAKPFTTALEAIAYAVTSARLDRYYEAVHVRGDLSFEVMIDYGAQIIGIDDGRRATNLSFPAFEALRKVPFKIKEEKQ